MRCALIVALLFTTQICCAEKFSVTELERKQFYKNMGFSLFRVNGEMAGYKITDFTNEKYYKAVGLEVGNIITHINGYDLRIIEQIGKAVSLMKSGNMLEFIYVDELRGKPKKALIEFNVVEKN